MAYRFPKVLAVVAASATALAGCSAAEETNNTNNSSGSDDAALSFTDLAGRDVELDKAPERVLLGEGRSIFATGILNTEDPLDKVVGIGSDLKKNVPDYYNVLEEKLPKVTELPEVGAISKGDVTVENLVSLDPDLIVLSKDQYDASQEAGLTEKMDQAGLKYAVTDFPPSRWKTPPSPWKSSARSSAKKSAPRNSTKSGKRPWTWSRSARTR